MTNDDGPQVRVVDRRWWAQGATEGEAEPARKPTYVEDLEARLADAVAQLQRVSAEHRRALDEFEQVKARIRREQSREVERSTRAVIAGLLEVLDNLDRALGAAPPAAASVELQTFLRGVELVRDQFLAKLEALGVTRIAALGQPFDARRHEAVTTAPAAQPGDEGTIVSVLKEGYTIGDDLLRPASVVVAREQPES